MPLKLNSTGGGAVTLDVPSTGSTYTATLQAVNGNIAPLVSATAQTASSTSVDFLNIPSWVKRITVMFNGVSTSGTSSILFQIGSGAAQTTGYISGSSRVGASAAAGAGYTAGFGLNIAAAADTYGGFVTFANLSGNIWVGQGSFGNSATSFVFTTSGQVTLSGTLDRVRITTVNGTDTFDAGTINIMYEG